MRGKIKYKSKRKQCMKAWYIAVVLIIILVCISTSYSLFGSRLTVVGNVKLNKEDPELPVEITPPSSGSTADDGSTRYTSNTNLTFLGIELFSVQSEEFSDNELTTTIIQTYKAIFGFTSANANITLTIGNSTSKDFTNGKVTLIESNDPNGVFQNAAGKVSKEMIAAGGEGTVSITGSLRGNQNVANNTYYKFAITYEVDGVTRYFYYTLKILPRAQ